MDGMVHVCMCVFMRACVLACVCALLLACVLACLPVQVVFDKRAQALLLRELRRAATMLMGVGVLSGGVMTNGGEEGLARLCEPRPSSGCYICDSVFGALNSSRSRSSCSGGGGGGAATPPWPGGGGGGGGGLPSPAGHVVRECPAGFGYVGGLMGLKGRLQELQQQSPPAPAPACSPPTGRYINYGGTDQPLTSSRPDITQRNNKASS